MKLHLKLQLKLIHTLSSRKSLKSFFEVQNYNFKLFLSESSLKNVDNSTFNTFNICN